MHIWCNDSDSFQLSTERKRYGIFAENFHHDAFVRVSISFKVDRMIFGIAVSSSCSKFMIEV